MPVQSGTKEPFFTKLETLIAEAKRLRVSGFDEQEPEEATKQLLLEPLFSALGFTAKSGYVREYKILGDAVDYLLGGDHPLMFVEAKSLHDCPKTSLFDKHREQVLRYIQNYRLSPEITQMEQPVAWILLTNFDQFHFVRVNETVPTFSLRLDELWARREELWELLALESLEAGRIDELYNQHLKAGLDQQFLADLKDWRLLIANGFALRNPQRSLEDITLASQQLLDRFIFCRMLETRRLVEYNKLARAYSTYEVLFGRADKNFSEVVRESVFIEIKNDFNTELFEQPLLCDQLEIDNAALAAVVGHEPLAPDLAATCGFEAGPGEPLAFRHLYSYDFSLMSADVMGAVYERFLAHKLEVKDGRVLIEETDELRKKEGIYYTPKYIVDYIVAHTLGEKIKPILAEAKALLGCKNFTAAFAKIRELAQIKVLDPAMGSGSFLLGAFDALVAAYNDYNAECERRKRAGGNGEDALFDAPAATPRPVDRLGTRVVSDNLFGVDLDQQAVEVAKLNLWIRLMAAEKDSLWMKLHDPANGKKPRQLLPALTSNFKRGNSLIADQAVAGETAFDWPKQFPETMQRGGFDVVIGNPPYERIQTMQAYAPESAESLKANYHSAASGNFDIYVCFIERGLQLLAANGCFGYICPHKFFQAEYGEAVRKLLSEGNHVRHILSFGDLQIFPQVSTYTCLLFLGKEPSATIHFSLAADVDAFAERREIGKSFSVKASSLSRGEWIFTSEETSGWMRKAEAAGKPLSEVAKEVFVGLQTSADDVFLFEAVSVNKGVCAVMSASLGKQVKLEAKLLKPVVRSGEIGRFWAKATHLVLFPYALRKGEAELLSEAELAKKFPLAWDYLQQNKAKLAARESGKFADKGWWQLYPKNLEFWESPKILAPYMIQRLSACYDTDDNYFVNVTTGGFGLRFESEQQDKLVCGLMNSTLLDAYLKQVSTNFRGGYFAANKQFLDKLPIKLIDPKKKAEVKLEREIVERVEQIQTAHRQRVKLPEVLARLIAHNASRVPCNLAHYLQKDFAAALQPEILIDDVQRAGFVHEIQMEADGKELTLTAIVADKATGEPSPLPVLRLAFKDDALRQFIYACWRQFLTAHSRQKKWTKGKKPEAIYPLLVNTLAPLVHFAPAAGDNLRALRDLMKAVAAEAGSADLAAIESEIEKLDREIDGRVYELYGLTPQEIQIVQGGR